MMAEITFNVVVHEESDGSFWAEVSELPGCFASGYGIEELEQALVEAIQMCLPEGVSLGDSVAIEHVSENHALVRA